ncbi:UNVERIFIED_CONTAM: hypothetical protein Sradi_2989600 [Sesamum radiatum]|uniref:Reverse transcriptase Ty1/copia-type domain-containing protein n=1 Tax=Sesamum radiatum TaxID=300843 RepID=A0AAW2S2S5_SESRA
MSLLVYVDDILIAGPSINDIKLIKSYLHDLFTIKDIGHPGYFLGLELSKNNTSTYVSQNKYTLDVIKDTGLLHAKAVSAPFLHGLKLSSDCGALLHNPDSIGVWLVVSCTWVSLDPTYLTVFSN